MGDLSFPHSAETVTATLSDLLRHQGHADLVELLESGTADIKETGYDNLDGGIYYYTLFLAIPLELYARIESDVDRMQGVLARKLRSTFKSTGDRLLTDVVISPIVRQVVSTTQRQKARTVEGSRLWEPGFLRLFLSHVAAHKVGVARLKEALHVLGVSGFVAHEDIEPSREWQEEIEKALASMHALVALLTPDYKASRWTDQEVGVALGRGVLVVPVKLGMDPYGFIGKHQALSGNLDYPKRLALAIVEILTKQEATWPLVREGLVAALEKASSFAAAKAVTVQLEGVSHFTAQQLERLEAALESNNQVDEAFGVPARIREIVKRQRPRAKKQGGPS